MSRILILGICLLLAATIAAILYFGIPAGGVKRSAQINAYYHLQVAHQRFVKSGELVSSANKVFVFTNTFKIRNQDYQCIMAMEWPHGCPEGTLVAATGNGTTLWLEPGKSPKVISFPGVGRTTR